MAWRIGPWMVFGFVKELRFQDFDASFMKVKGGIWWNRWWTKNGFIVSSTYTRKTARVCWICMVSFALTRLGCGRLHFTEGMIVMVPMLGNTGRVVHALLKGPQRGLQVPLGILQVVTSQDGIPVQLSVLLSYFFGPHESKRRFVRTWST
jgi:hypothetical protein